MTTQHSAPKTKTAIYDPADGGPPFRRGVVLVLLNDADEALCFHRADGLGWQWPQGGIDEGEEVITAAWRELYEETGLTASHATLLGTLPLLTETLYPDYVLAKHAAGEKFKYRGQQHSWMVFRLAPDAENFVRYDVNPAEIEFNACAWQPLSWMEANIVDFKKAAYAAALKALADFLLKVNLKTT